MDRARTKDVILVFFVLLAMVEVIGCFMGDVEICKIATYIGSEPVYIIISSLLIIFIDKGLGVRVTLAVALASSLTVLGKTVLKMPRPPMEEWLVEASGYGFPSGHATLSAAFWASLYLETRSRIVLLVGVLHTLAVSYSRVFLGVHFVRDVIGGIFIGVTITLLVYKLLYKMVRLPSWIVVSSIIVVVLGIVSLSQDPGYDSAIRLTGIGLGTLIAGLVVWRGLVSWKPLVEPVSLKARIASLLLLIIGLVIARISEEATLTGILGYSFLAFIVFMGRPLAARLLSGDAKQSTE